MGLWFWALPIAGMFLQGALVWRLWNRHLARHYPLLSACVLLTLLRDVGMTPVVLYSAKWFALVFWKTAIPYLFLQFLIDAEFFRHAFSRYSAVREIGLKALYLTALGASPVILLLAWRQLGSPERLIYSPAAEQYIDLLQAMLLLIPVLVARYYGISLGRNLRSLALGFGIYSSLNAMNFAAFQAFHNFFQYWRYVSPVSYLLMISIWLWGFWDYAPAPETTEMPRQRLDLINNSARAADTGI